MKKNDAKSDSLLFELTKLEIVVIVVYYFIILLIGVIISIKTLCTLGEEMSHKLLMSRTIVSSLSVSGMLCSVQYIRRIYKACITDRIVPITTFAGSIGNLVYFLLRPFYAFVFVIVMIFMLLSGMFVVTGCLDYIINEKFLYLCVIISSFIGFSVGQLLDKFESISRKKIDELK